MVQYLINALAPFPKRWSDRYGKFTVMGEPIKGYVMCRRPRCAPFILSVPQILNTDPHERGPFECLEKTEKRVGGLTHADKF